MKVGTEGIISEVETLQAQTEKDTPVRHFYAKKMGSSLLLTVNQCLFYVFHTQP